MLESLIITIALSNGLDPILLLAVSFQETRIHNVINYNDGGSPSYGVAQVKEIAKRQVASEGDLENLEDSIDIAAKYLMYNIKHCKGIEAGVAGYNRGKCIKSTEYSRNVMNYYESFKQKYYWLNY